MEVRPYESVDVGVAGTGIVGDGRAEVTRSLSTGRFARRGAV
jgi:hypothetical protein